MGIPGFEDFDLPSASVYDVGYMKLVVDDALVQETAQAAQAAHSAQLFLPGNTIDTPQLPAPGSSGTVITELEYVPTTGAKLTAVPGKTTTVIGSYNSDTKYIIDELDLSKSTDFSGNPGGL